MNLENFIHFKDLHSSRGIPKSKGVYVWIDSKTNQVVYIGSATGKLGLYGRIHAQHLNPNYVETRPTVHSQVLDKFQLAYPVQKVGIDGSLKKGIDKSVFRRAIGRLYSMKPGKPTVDHILNNYHLFYKIVENKVEALRLESILISENLPTLNNG
jgi:hypothetical protein